MPTPESPETRGTILHCIAVAASTLRDIAQFTPIPFLATIASLSTSILAMSVRSYKRECLDMMERTHEILCAIINLTAAPEPEATFSPEVLGNVGHFAQTLQMIYIFVESQQSMSKIRKLFQHAENAAQLEKCKAALQHAHDIFMVQSGIITTISMADMQRIVQRRHEELMTLLSDQSQSDCSDSSSIDSRDLYSVGNKQVFLKPR
ncbi:hypothetical protein B0H10DRAFT_1948875 [Mycena sp. CBHHK59/15]|nr:hypothetical protein B0H10DRAFT_1948875 [Mycena sp. CBHHK59/15]